MAKILVTGVNGFVGQHLVKELSEHGHEVIGVAGPAGSLEESPYVSSYFRLDLSRPGDVGKIDFKNIDGVIHLAGLAAVGASFDDPMLYVSTNVGIEVNLYEAAVKQQAKPRFLIVSSGSLYDAGTSLPLNEESAVLPSSPYAVSKLGQEQMAAYYQTRGFEYIIARPFNHIGPGQGLGFLIPDLANQVVAAEKGKTDQILAGNLDAKRDYTDVRDIVRAYRLLLEKGRSGEIYNICSGKALSGHEVLQQLLTLSKAGEPQLAQDPEKMRPSDTPVIYGSCDKLQADTGWRPEIDLEKTLSDVIDDWRGRS
jgi:GDP-4-dehydro-6-deoxy-D-mannose reductase